MNAVVILFAVSLLAPAGGDADITSFTTRFEEGRVLFDSGKFAEAAAVFSQLHRESGDSNLLYPTAQSLRLAGRCVEALVAYGGFVDASPDLRVRVQRTNSAARLERLTVDLNNARARLVQMRRCIGRVNGERAQTEARSLRVAGDPEGAIGLLSRLWEQTRDPTILPDLAELHRITGDCGRAKTLLELAVSQMTPLEVIATDEADDPDLDAGRVALEKARRTLAGSPCTSPLTTTRRALGDTRAALVRSTLSTGPVPALTIVRANPDRSGVYALVAGGVGAALALGGGACFWKAHAIQNRVNTYRQQGWDPVEGPRLLDRGDSYERAALGLTVAGGVFIVGAYLYSWENRERKASSRPVVQASGTDTTVGWVFEF